MYNTTIKIGDESWHLRCYQENYFFRDGIGQLHPCFVDKAHNTIEYGENATEGEIDAAITAAQRSVAPLGPLPALRLGQPAPRL